MGISMARRGCHNARVETYEDADQFGRQNVGQRRQMSVSGGRRILAGLSLFFCWKLGLRAFWVRLIGAYDRLALEASFFHIFVAKFRRVPC